MLFLLVVADPRPSIQSNPIHHSKLGRPCCLAIHSVTLRGGAFPPTSHVHVEVGLFPGEHEQNLSSPTSLPPLATPPRLPVAAGDIDEQGRVDHVLLPSVTATSTLLLTVLLDKRPIATLRYPLADVAVTLRPTELRLTPEAHGGEGAVAARGGAHSLFGGGGRRRSESPKPGGGGAVPSSPLPLSATAADVGAEQQPTRLGAVWGELSFFDNRTCVSP